MARNHILSHIEEKYYVPSLLVKALEAGGASDAVRWAVGERWGQCQYLSPLSDKFMTAQVRKLITRQCYRQLGLAGWLGGTMLEFISILDDTGRTSRLSHSDKTPGTLRVVGVLPHGREIRPKTEADRYRLVTWLYGLRYPPVETVPPPKPIDPPAELHQLEHAAIAARTPRSLQIVERAIDTLRSHYPPPGAPGVEHVNDAHRWPGDPFDCR